jgi:uncharacterized protein YyaL (SSP411 family)
MPQLLCAFEWALEPPRHVVITGRPESAGFRDMVSAANERLGPRRTLIALDGVPGAREWFSARMPWLEKMGSPDSRATAFVCEEFVCRAPAHSPAELRVALGQGSGKA